MQFFYCNLEPRLLYDNTDVPIFLKISADAAAKGADGDVRDVICLRKGTLWEIGFSCKHNHEGELWREAFTNKEDDIYVPALTDIRDEIERLCKEHNDVPRLLLEYFFGSKDFYKVISLERTCQAKVVAFNMSGTLNSAIQGHKPLNKIPMLHMPTRLIEVRFKEKNTGEISKFFLYSGNSGISCI